LIQELKTALIVDRIKERGKIGEHDNYTRNFLVTGRNVFLWNDRIAPSTIERDCKLTRQKGERLTMVPFSFVTVAITVIVPAALGQ
jgi:hypothetical protein